MAIGRIQLKRGTYAEMPTADMLQGELYYATDQQKIYSSNGDGTVKELARGTELGDLTYTEENYVTTGQDVTTSIDALDVAVKDNDDAIHDVEDWITFSSYQNNYAAASDWGGIQYRKMPNGFVVLRGWVDITGTLSSSIIGTLPVGYRPTRNMGYATRVRNTEEVVGILYVASSGAMGVNNYSAAQTAGGTQVSFDCVSFFVD